MKDLNSVVAIKIKELREQKNILQKAFAQQIDMTPSAYSRLENGETQITLNSLQIIAVALKKDLTELLQIKDKTSYTNNNSNFIQQGTHHTLHLHLSSEQFEDIKNVVTQAPNKKE